MNITVIYFTQCYLGDADDMIAWNRRAGEYGHAYSLKFFNQGIKMILKNLVAQSLYINGFLTGTVQSDWIRLTVIDIAQILICNVPLYI